MNLRTRIVCGPPLALVVAVAVAGNFALAADKSAPPQSVSRRDPLSLSRRIDQGLGTALTTAGVTPAPRAVDAEFLRRAYLDITGVIPPADKVAAFLDSTDPDKRAKLIDELLASPNYGRHMADIWQALLVESGPDNRRLNFQPLTGWLEQQFNDNKPWDQFTTELLTASGEQDKDPAITFFLANGTPDKLTDRVTRDFLGVRLQCAQCHNHPFTRWKQDDYWGMAAFFTRVRTNGNPRQAANQGTVLAISEGGGEGRPLRLPMSAKRVSPRFFLGDTPKVRAAEPLRPVLAQWMTSADNPYFARALVNRLWGQFLGRGFVNPVDDFQDDNKPSHPELLQELSRQFAANGFDVKFAIRAICNSQAYQRTSKAPAADQETQQQLFDRMTIKPMTPQQLYDSLELVLGRGAVPDGPRRGQQRGAPRSPRDAFVNFFHVDDTADPTEYQAGIPQSLRLMNMGLTNNGATWLNALVKDGKAPAEIVERIFLATLSRRPTQAESQHLVNYVARHGADRAAYGDILWAAVNSSEFTLNH